MLVIVGGGAGRGGSGGGASRWAARGRRVRAPERRERESHRFIEDVSSLGGFERE